MGKTLPRPAPRRPPSPAAAPPAPTPARLDPVAAEAFVRGVDLELPRPSRAPAGTRALVERADGRTRRKMLVYLAPDTAESLLAFCRAEGREISHTVDAAVRAYLDARASTRT